MTDDEKQLFKTGAEAALKPFSNLMERLFGGAVDQVGGMWEDQLRARRQVRQLEIMKRLKAHIEEVGFQPQPIPDKIWLPALQAAMNEDDPTLQEMWADLLANAANPDVEAMSPAFPEVLRQLSSADARFLRDIVATYKNNFFTVSDSPLSGTTFSQWYEGHPIEGPNLDLTNRLRALRQPFRITLDNLLRLGLLEKTTVFDGSAATAAAILATRGARKSVGHSQQTLYGISALGQAFLAACSRPSQANEAEGEP